MILSPLQTLTSFGLGQNVSELTESSEKYLPLPDEIMKVERKKANELAEAGAQESFGNNEVEKLQCMRCIGDETDCGTLMLVRTRSKATAELGDVSGGKILLTLLEVVWV